MTVSHTTQHNPGGDTLLRPKTKKSDPVISQAPALVSPSGQTRVLEQVENGDYIHFLFSPFLVWRWYAGGQACVHIQTK